MMKLLNIQKEVAENIFFMSENNQLLVMLEQPEYFHTGGGGMNWYNHFGK